MRLQPEVGSVIPTLRPHYVSPEGAVTPLAKCKDPVMRNGMQSRCKRCDPCSRWDKHNWLGRYFAEAVTSRCVLFVTLTFSDRYLDRGRSLDPKFVRNYVEGLRRRYGYKFRYLACAENGDKTGRPHFHLLLFFDRAGPPPSPDHFPANVRTRIAAWKYGYGQVEAPRDMVKSVTYIANYIDKPESTLFACSQGMGKAYLLNYAEFLGRNRRPLSEGYGMQYTVAGARKSASGNPNALVSGVGKPWRYLVPRSHDWMRELAERYIKAWIRHHGDQPPPENFKGLDTDWFPDFL